VTVPREGPAIGDGSTDSRIGRFAGSNPANDPLIGRF